MSAFRRALVLALVWTSGAAAEPPARPSASGGALVVTSTDACLTPPSMVHEIERFRTRRPNDERLRIDLRGEGRGVIAEIFRDDAPVGERPFPDVPVDCNERRRLVGIALAVALERLEVETPSPPEPPRVDAELPASVAPEPTPPASSTSPRAEPPRPSRPRTRPRSHDWVAGLHGEASAGLFPTPGFGAGISIGPRWDRASIDLGADVQYGLSYALGAGDVDLDLLFVSARGCLALVARSSLRLDACLAFLAGRWHAAGRGYGKDSVTNQAWVSASAGLRGTLALTSALGVRLDVDAVVPATRGSLEVRDGSDTLRAETTPVGIVAYVGPTLGF